MLKKSKIYIQNEEDVHCALIEGDRKLRRIVVNNGMKTIKEYNAAKSRAYDTLQACRTLDDIRSISAQGHKDAGSEERAFTSPDGIVIGFCICRKRTSDEEMVILVTYDIQDISGISHPSTVGFDESIDSTIFGDEGGYLSDDTDDYVLDEDEEVLDEDEEIDQSLQTTLSRLGNSDDLSDSDA